MANSPSGESLVHRVARVLRAFDAGHQELSAADVSRRAGLASSTAHRLVREMVQEGLLRRTEDGRYRIGLELWALVQRGSSDEEFGRLALPFLEAIHVSQRQTTALSIVDDVLRSVVYLERMVSRDEPSDLTSVAGRLPVLSTASGLAVLAFRPPEVQESYLRAEWDPYTRATGLTDTRVRELLERTRRDGYVHMPGVLVPGSTGTAAPVFGPGGAVLGALSIVATAAEADVRMQLPALLAAASGLSRTMGAVGRRG